MAFILEAGNEARKERRRAFGEKSDCDERIDPRIASSEMESYKVGMHEEWGWKRRERKKGGASFYRVLLNFGNFVYLSDFAPFLKPCIIVRVQKNKDKDIAIKEK